MMLDELQIHELYLKVTLFDCPVHPDGGCNPQVCLECQQPLCGDATACPCECNCDGGEQGEGLVSIPHDEHCPRWRR